MTLKWRAVHCFCSQVTSLVISVGGPGNSWCKASEKRFGTFKGLEKPKPRAERATGNLLANVKLQLETKEKGMHDCDEHHWQGKENEDWKLNDGLCKSLVILVPATLMNRWGQRPDFSTLISKSVAATVSADDTRNFNTKGCWKVVWQPEGYWRDWGPYCFGASANAQG